MGQVHRASLFAQKQGNLPKSVAAGEKVNLPTCKKNQDCQKYPKCKNIFGGSTCRCNLGKCDKVTLPKKSPCQIAKPRKDAKDIQTAGTVLVNSFAGQM